MSARLIGNNLAHKYLVGGLKPLLPKSLKKVTVVIYANSRLSFDWRLQQRCPG